MKDELEEVLEAIWKADERGTSALDEIRRGCPMEIQEMHLEVLEKRQLIIREADQIRLTFEGRESAKNVVRRHRLAESLFATILDLDIAKREAIACEVEHTLLPEVEEAICTLLGHPTLCPDGKPIPPGRCCSAGRKSTPTVIVNLTSLKPGERGRISYIKPKEHERLHRLISFGLTPGTVIEVHQRFPVFSIRYEGTELALNTDVADDIYVSKMD